MQPRMRKSVIIEKKLQCPTCGSSDALVRREDNSTYCFSCMTNTIDSDMKEELMTEPYTDMSTYKTTPTQYQTIESISEYQSYPISSRGITKEVVDHFNVKMQTSEDGSAAAHLYPYTRDGKIVAYKKRELPKVFSTIGQFNSDLDLFGQKQATDGKYIVITEGEIDCMSIAQANLDSSYNKIFPVVAVTSASATKTITNNRKWLNGFERVILMMDNDEAGDKIKAHICKVLTFGKVYVAANPMKDANELLQEQGSEAIMQALWNAREYTPAGIIKGEQIWEQYNARRLVQSIPYPPCLDGINAKTKGIRQGEITLFTSGTGAGKSTIIKEIVLHILADKTSKVGLISLEESVGDTTEKFLAMQMKRNLSEEESTDEERRQAFEEVFGNENLILLDHQGSVGDSSLMDNIEHLCAMGCKYLILDHITIAVSEGSDGLVGNAAIDKMMSDLLKVVKKNEVWLGLISHLRKAPAGAKSFEDGLMPSVDDIKGSGSLKQISFDIIAFARNITAENENERNTTRFRVLKSRFTGRTGDAGSALYDPKTTRMTHSKIKAFDDETEVKKIIVEGFGEDGDSFV